MFATMLIARPSSSTGGDLLVRHAGWEVLLDMRGGDPAVHKSGCDVDTATVRQGSPHRLVVTKNQASYERLARQRREDIKLLATIEAARAL